MKNKENTLFALYKKGIHLGNQRGVDITDAIKNYLIAASYGSFVEDKVFVSLYSAKVAIKNIHFL